MPHHTNKHALVYMPRWLLIPLLSLFFIIPFAFLASSLAIERLSVTEKAFNENTSDLICYLNSTDYQHFVMFDYLRQAVTHSYLDGVVTAIGWHGALETALAIYFFIVIVMMISQIMHYKTSSDRFIRAYPKPNLSNLLLILGAAIAWVGCTHMILTAAQNNISNGKKKYDAFYSYAANNNILDSKDGAVKGKANSDLINQYLTTSNIVIINGASYVGKK